MTQSKLILFFLLCSVVAFLPLDVRLRCDFIPMDHNNATSFWCRDQGRDGFVSRQLDMCSAFNCYVYFAKLPFYVDFRGRKNQNSDEEIKWIEIKSNELCKWYIAVDDDVDDDPTRWKGKIVEFTNIDRAHRLWIAIWANTYGNCWIYIFDVCHSFSPYDSGSNQFGNFIMRAPCNFLVLFVLFFFWRFALSSSSSTEVPCARHAIIPHLYSMRLDCNSSWFFVSVAATAAHLAPEAAHHVGMCSSLWSVAVQAK